MPVFAAPPAGRPSPWRLAVLLSILLAVLVWSAGAAWAKRAPKPAAEVQADPRAASLAKDWLEASEADLDRRVVAALAGLGDRSTGTEGCRTAAAALEAFFRGLDAGEVGRLTYRTPAMRHGPASLTVEGREGRLPLSPLALNALTPGAVPAKGLAGPLVDGGQGGYRDFDGKPVRGGLALMDLDSGRNWQAAAQLGAKALLYVDHSPDGAPVDRGLFADKFELTPVRFPRFLVSAQALAAYLGPGAVLDGSLDAPRARIFASARWETVLAEDVYLFFPGTDPALAGQLLLVDAPYDATAVVPGRAPGADEAASVAALLRLARDFAAQPPARPVLLAAVAGHAQSQAGLRELFAALRGKGKDLRGRAREVKAERQRIDETLAALAALKPDGEDDQAGLDLDAPLVREALFESLKDEVDAVTTALMRLRLVKDPDQAAVAGLAERRAVLRRILWRERFRDLAPVEIRALLGLVPAARARLTEAGESAAREATCLGSARVLRQLVADRDLVAQISLFLSSHGDGVGGFCQGFTYDVKPEINQAQAYGRINRALVAAAEASARGLGLPAGYYRDGMRADRQHPWQGLLPDRPGLGGEIGAVAGLLGVSLATVGDARPTWGTPGDTPDRVDVPALTRQSRFVADLVAPLAGPDFEPGEKRPRNVFSTLSGRVNFIRQGELFPERPAPGTVVCVYQGKTRFYAATDARGIFRVNGLANKKLVLDKAVIEGFRFDPETGAAIWAIDKKQTGKDAYRVKMNRSAMETDLVMFGCEQTTLFSAFDPRSFRYFTRIELLDAKREAPPLRSWYSRLDTLDSTLLSIFLEPGTSFKCILSDTVLSRKLILLNASPEHPTGLGYRIDQWPILPVTELLGSRDMWDLLGPRVANLEAHGVVNERIRELQTRGRALFDEARAAETALRYDDMVSAARASWGLAVRVYNDVEKTQRDVLLGVLFYIALFIPFAYCLERVVFNYVDIHKRIAAFLGILITVITVVYQVHPAFKLTYSPLVVILAFFILGLSVMVAAIIFLRFEREMIALQRRASHVKATEIGGMRAFAAAFVIGVSNLRRRKVRTALTCLTLIILTFTIMSFTAVKSTREEGAVELATVAPYRGVLLKNLGWRSLPPEALGVLGDAYGARDVVAPLAWLELPDKTRSPATEVRAGARSETVQGVLGLSAAEADIGRLGGVLDAGRWFASGERDAVILPRPMAERLGVAPGDRVEFFGRSMLVAGIYRKNALDARVDLDGESITPVLFPSEAAVEVTEAEKEAVDAGEDVRTLQSRYQHLDDDLTAIVPYETLLGLGGQLKSIAVVPPGDPSAGQVPDDPAVGLLAGRLADRFGLTVFSGDASGVRVYHSGDALDYAGVPNILIPLVISVLIVLNTMIGAVYERKREIGVYTAVGLAPSHVSFLFIAEALAFAVISVVLGYLLAQTAAGLLAGTRLWAGMTANYSSLAGVAAMLLVIGVVLLSVVYPSKMAADIAIPDVNRTFRLPTPVGGIIRTRLPFLVKVREQECAGGFLIDYYQAHQDISHGLFSTADVNYAFKCPWDVPGAPAHPKVRHPQFCDLRACLHLTATVWLAPFDFGIKQVVAIDFIPAMDTPGFMEIDVEISRLAGENGMWRRLNKGFVNDLRKQLLVWRSLEESVRTAFEDRVVGAGSMPPEEASDREERA
jgi:hypothetical protein